MSWIYCPNDGSEMKFDHTDYYDFDIYICPKCGHETNFSSDDYGIPEDYEYDDDDDDEEDFGYDDEPSLADLYPLEVDDDIDPRERTGFYTSVDGDPVHIQGDPEMNEETFQALQELIRAAQRALDSGWRPKSDKK